MMSQSDNTMEEGRRKDGRAHRQDVAVVGMKPLLLRVARFVQLYNLDIVAPGQQIRNLFHRVVLAWQHGCVHHLELAGAAVSLKRMLGLQI
jgi:hypothetical protein